MAKSEQEIIDGIMGEIAELGALNINDNWIDGRGGYVVTVDFGDNHTCQAVDVDRLKAYSDAKLAAKVLKASL